MEGLRGAMDIPGAHRDNDPIPGNADFDDGDRGLHLIVQDLLFIFLQN